VERVERFFADELQRRPYDVAALAVALEKEYRDSDRPHLAERIREMLPEFWADD
jgi:hypothetical protein